MRVFQSKGVVGIAALAAVLAFGTAASAQTVTVNKCAAAKTKCVTGKVKGLLGCHQKAEGKSLAVDPACISKAEAKFLSCMTKPEAKPPCLTTGDAASMEAAIDAYVLDVVQELDPGYPAPVTNKCSVGKKKNVAAKTAGKLGCLAKAFGKAPGTVDPACLTKAETKFASAWAKLEAKPPCLTVGDAAALEAKVDAFYSDTVAALGSTCGNGANDAGEACDASAPAAGWAKCGPTFICTSCNCACPTKVTFAGDATDAATVLDTGWTGISHRAPAVTNGEVTVSLSCSATERPCGVCTVSGPIANSAGQLQNQRCNGDTSVSCSSAPGGVAGCGGPLGTCEFFFGAPLSLAAGGVTTCVYNQFAGSVAGTANVETGEAANSAALTARVYTGISIDSPCPRCIGDGVINDGLQGGACSGGPRNGMPCDANGTVPGRPDFGASSLDCTLAAGVLIATLPIDLTNATDPVVKTVSAASPVCSGSAGERCLCDTCNTVNAEPCDSDADCLIDPPGPIGPVCGGKRCIGGTNLGAPCTLTSECPGGGICSRPGEPTKPSACLDDTNTVNVLDCTDTIASGSATDGEGECTQGPVTQSCSLASGHAQRGCLNDAACGGGVGSCESNNRQCFLTGGFSGKNGTNTLIAVGMEDAPMADVSHPTLGAVFCVGPTGSTSVNNVAGLPGPGRVTIKGTAVGKP